MTSSVLTGEAIKRYVLAGNARFTLVSKKTGRRFTYRVRAAEERRNCPRLWFVEVLTGSDNGSDYTYLGTIQGETYRHGSKSRIAPDALSAKAFSWAWREDGLRHPLIEVYHEGRCGRCGRALTVPESVSSGLGPECAGRVAA